MRRLIRLVIPGERAGVAMLDFLAHRFTYHSRVEWQARIAAGRMTVNGRGADAAQLLLAGDELAYDADDIPEPPMDDRIAIVHCDEDMVIVDKSGNLTCHPCGRYFNHTLWALLKTRHGIANPIFVNRIDRETSGLVVVARTPEAAKKLRAQFSGRTVEKRYLALVEGAFPASCSAAGWIVADYTGEVLKKRRFVLVAEGRARPPDPPLSGNMAANPQFAAADGACSAHALPAEAQWAMTEFRLRSTHGPVSLIEACPHTGRLHQIRVALQALGFSLVGDKMYGVDPGVFLRFCRDALTPEDFSRMRMKRQALHAAGLRFLHPGSGKSMAFDLPLPDDMQALLGEYGADGAAPSSSFTGAG